MKNGVKKALSILIIFCMLLTSLPTTFQTAFAADGEDVTVEVLSEEANEMSGEEGTSFSAFDSEEAEEVSSYINEETSAVESEEITTAVQESEEVFSEEFAETESISEETQTEAQVDTETTSEETTAVETQKETEAVSSNNNIEETEKASEETTTAEETATAEEETEVSMPEKTFTGQAGDVYVSVWATEGTFPERTEMVVKAVEAAEVIDSVQEAMDDDTVAKEDVHAVDITFVYEGNEIQPEKPVRVTLSTPEIPVAEDAERSIVHIHEDEAEVIKDGIESKTTSVNAEQFSIYVVVETGDDARLQVNFVNGDNQIASPIVKKSDMADDDLFNQIIYDPGAGELPTGTVFRGWTTKRDYTTEDIASALTIDGIRAAVKAKLNDGVTESGGIPEQMTFYAMTFHIFNITYRDEDNVVIKNEALLTKGESIDYTVDQPYTPKTSDQEFQGWFVGSENAIAKDGEMYVVGDTIQNKTAVTVSKDVILSAKAPEGAWLIFKENGSGASYTPPQFLEGIAPTKPQDPVRNGYTFGGWYTDEACTDGNEFDFSAVLERTTRIYAKWSPIVSAPYTVIIWQQNLNANGYDFVESISLTGTVGQPVNTVTSQGTGDNAYARINETNYRYTGFHLDRFDQNVTVNPEGTAVVNVYYNRTSYTLTFRRDRTGTVYKTITALYGQFIGDNFPITENGASAEWRWSPQSSNTFKNVLVYIDIMPAENVTFYRSTSTAGTKYMEFYVEALPGQTADRTWNGRSFVKYGNTLTAKYNYFTEAEDFLELTGYEKYGSDPAFVGGSANVSTGGTIRFYYTRKEYSLNYMDGVYVDGDGNAIEEASRGQLREERGIAYGADLSTYNKGGNNYYKPTYVGYEFEGWFVDDTCKQEYTFTTMPEGGMTLYAKWRQVQYRIFLHPNADDYQGYSIGDQSTSFRLDYGEGLTAIDARSDDYELVGWYTDATCTNAINFDAFVANDSNITTAYDKTESTERNQYGNPTEVTNKDATNNRFWITKKLDLYAKWRSKLLGANGINVVYDAGEGTFSEDVREYTDPLTYKDQATAVATTATTPDDADKYEFEYWDLQKWDGSAFVSSGVTVLPGDGFEVKKAEAQVVENEGSTSEKPSYTYTIKLVAVYKAIEEETTTHIDWYANNTTTAVKSDDGLKMNTPIAIEPATLFTYEGYEFIGWARYETGSKPSSPTDDSQLWLVYDKDAKTFKENGKVVTQVACDEKQPYHDLYAVWAPIQYTVIFDKNADDAIGTMENQTFKFDEEKALTANAFARANYEFLGWSTDASATTATYTDAQTVKNLATEADAEITLYAVWKQSVADVTVEHYLLGTETAFKTDTIKDQKVGETYTAVPETTYQEKNLTVNSYDPTQAITVKADGNIIKIYYTLQLTITGKTDSKTYDGTPLAGEYTITGALADDEASIKEAIGAAPSITNVADSPKEYQADVTSIPSYYVVETNTAGTLTITPAELTITTEGDTKVYDGTPLTKDVAEIEGLVNGETATIEATGSQTEVGESDNTYNLTWDGTAKASNYEIKTETLGKLVVTEYAEEITVTTTGGTFTYDGKAHGATVEVSELPTGYTLETATSSATATDVTTEAVAAKCDTLVIKNAAGEDVTFKLKITYVDGTIVITPAELKITTEGDTKVYDGTPLTKDAAAIEGLVNNETATIEATGSQTEVGSSDNTYKLTWNGTAKESNYTITSETLGKLVVTETEEEITVTTTGGTFTYDGKAHGATVEVSELPTGYTLDTATSSATATDVTPKAVAATCDTLVIKNAAGEDVTSKLNITYVDGEIMINPATLTVTTPDASKEYDGTALTAEGTISGFVNNETATFKTTGSQTEAGKSDNTYEITWDGTAKESNYTVSETVGTLEVTKSKLPEDPDDPENTRFTVSQPADVVYNGKEQKQPVTVTDTKTGKALTADDITISYSDDVTNVGTVTITITANEDGNYEGSFTRTYKITPAKYSVKTGSASKEYDGSALTKDEAEIEGLVNGETATIKATGSQTEVGTSDNTYKLTWDGNAKESNYELGSEDLGKLEVTKATITDDPEDPDDPSSKPRFDVSKPEDVVYNGKEQKQPITITDTKTGKELVEGTDFELTYSEDVTNVGEVTITVKGIGSYTGEVTRTYKITPRSVILTSASDSKVYDGEALINNEVTVTGDGFVEGEGASYAVTGTQTLVGSSANEFTYILNDGTKADNYTITKTEGTLTVTDGTKPDDDKPVPDNLVVTKTSEDGATYGLGDTVEWTVTVTNIYDEEKTLTVTEAAGMTIVGTVPETLAAGEKITIKVQHVVTEADILAGSIKNEVTVKIGDLEKKGDDTVDTEDKNSHLTVVKTTTSTPANGTAYALGETITYAITATNDGNVTLTDVAIVDNLAGFTFDAGQVTTGITLAPGASATATGSYTVTEADVLAGSVVNTATARAKDPEDEDPTIVPSTRPEPTDSPNGHITINKVTTSTPANGATYALGETIAYSITAANDGNLTVSNITVNDALTGDTWTITSLAPGASQTFTATYVVTEADLITGFVRNVATATGTTEDGEPGVTPGTREDPTDPANGHITVTKVTTSATPAAGYAVGDVITYSITATNDGNLTMTNVSIIDSLPGFAFDAGQVTTGLTLAPGASVTVTGSYTVTAADQAAGTVVNNATATGDTPDGAPTPTPTTDGTTTDTVVPAPAAVVPAAAPAAPAAAPAAPAAAVPAADAPAADAPAAVVVPDTPAPAAAPATEPETEAPTEIVDEPTPEAAPDGAWALLNLLLTILAGIISIVLIILFFTKLKKKDDDEDENAEGEAATKAAEGEDEKEDKEKTPAWKQVLRWLSLIPVAAAIITFILTENMKLPMQIVDKWTILMAVFAAINVALIFLVHKWKKNSDDENEEENGSEATNA